MSSPHHILQNKWNESNWGVIAYLYTHFFPLLIWYLKPKWEKNPFYKNDGICKKINGLRKALKSIVWYYRKKNYQVFSKRFYWHVLEEIPMSDYRHISFHVKINRKLNWTVYKGNFYKNHNGNSSKEIL